MCLDSARLSKPIISKNVYLSKPVCPRNINGNRSIHSSNVCQSQRNVIPSKPVCQPVRKLACPSQVMLV